MSIKTCRVCHNNFFSEPLLHYDNMPKISQFFPDVKSLKNDSGMVIEVYQCSGCGLVQLNSKPVPYYKKVIRAVGISGEMKNFRKKQFSNFIKKHSLEKKKIIEIGCGRGEYSSIMNMFNINAYGLEYSTESVKYCQKNGLIVSKGFIENSTDKLKYAPFDAFYILNFLEHQPDPNTTLRGISNNLTDNAIGLIEVPNFDMILKNNLFSEFTSDHLFYFTKETLSSTLKQNGFEIIDCHVVWHNYIISAVVQKRKKLDISHFYKYQKKLKNEVEKYIAQFGRKKVAVWSAGHQALAIMSLLKLADKIKYVIDSAPFKQNKYTPATHIPILSPKALNSEPVEAIIVMAASYSDEVVKIIKQKYGKKINIAILQDFGLEMMNNIK